MVMINDFSDNNPYMKMFAEDFPMNTCLLDWTSEQGLRLLVCRGPFSYCAYIGVGPDHPFVGLEEFDFPCHHGVSYQGWDHAGGVTAKGWYFWGWDYGHCTDHIDYVGILPPGTPPEVLRIYQDMQDAIAGLGGPKTKQWTLKDVVTEGLEAMTRIQTMVEESQLEANKLIK